MAMDTLSMGRQVFDTEIEALQKTRDSLGETFEEILRTIIQCEGKLIITGMGKPGHIAAKMAATFASLGTPAFRLHPGEALHGDLGMVTDKDVVLAISYSGESDEITNILSNLRMIGAKIIAITGNGESTLAKAADIVQVFPAFREACFLNLAPTSSTTATLVYGDALAVVASAAHGFNEENFGLFHPAGSLGKKLLLRVADVMVADGENAVVNEDDTLKNAIIELSRKSLPIITVLHPDGTIAGVFTDGDLRRLLEKDIDLYATPIRTVMTASPICTTPDVLAAQALQVLKEKNITALPVVGQDGRPVGTITLTDIIKAGIV